MLCRVGWSNTRHGHPFNWCTTIWTDRSRLGHRPTATLAKHNGTTCLLLVKGRGGGRWDLNPRMPTPRVVSPTRPGLTTIVHDRFDHELRGVKYPQIERFMERLELDTLHSQPEEQRPPTTLLASAGKTRWIFVPPGPSRGAQSGASSSRPPDNSKE